MKTEEVEEHGHHMFSAAAKGVGRQLETVRLESVLHGKEDGLREKVWDGGDERPCKLYDEAATWSTEKTLAILGRRKDSANPSTVASVRGTYLAQLPSFYYF